MTYQPCSFLEREKFQNRNSFAFRASPSVWCITRMIRAMEQIRRMRGGAQSHLMRCSDGKDHNLYFVVKFQNNPQHSRVLVNELLGNRIARRMGLPVPRVEVVKVDPDLIRWTPALCIEMPRSSTPSCCPGLQFGSCHPGDPRRMTLHDFLPDELLREVKNIHDFAGMLVFDKWTCNTNGRQTLFFRETKSGLRSPGAHSDRARSGVMPTPNLTPSPSPSGGEGRYSTVMIDQGFCFNAGEWNYPDASARCAASTPATASTKASPAWNRSAPGCAASKILQTGCWRISPKKSPRMVLRRF